MPQTQTILQVFVASPGDVAEERKILESVVHEINLTLSDTHTKRLELLKWETHSRPGFGKDAQDVINQQIGDNYDIFLGIMWGRFGSPTPRAESGTEEEFNRAVSRWKDSPEHIQIMFYFKDAGIPPSKSEPEQLAKIHAFKKKISAQGVYSEFQDAEDFRTQASTHLRRVIQDWPKLAPSDPETAETTTTMLRNLEQTKFDGIWDAEIYHNGPHCVGHMNMKEGRSIPIDSTRSDFPLIFATGEVSGEYLLPTYQHPIFLSGELNETEGSGTWNNGNNTGCCGTWTATKRHGSAGESTEDVGRG